MRLQKFIVLLQLTCSRGFTLKPCQGDSQSSLPKMHFLDILEIFSLDMAQVRSNLLNITASLSFPQHGGGENFTTYNNFYYHCEIKLLYMCNLWKILDSFSDLTKRLINLHDIEHSSIIMLLMLLLVFYFNINLHCTTQDSKVMSWWDYGYQITAMANRTILVDNNTWNNTHISRVGQV